VKSEKSKVQSERLK